MPIDRSTSDNVPEEFEDTVDAGSNHRPPFRRHSVFETPPPNALSSHRISDEETASMDWNQLWTGVEDRPTSEEGTSSALWTRVLPLISQTNFPSSVSLSSTELQFDFHPFLLNPPTTESMFPCPETLTGTSSSRTRRRASEYVNSHPFENRRISLDDDLFPERSTSRRRLNLWSSTSNQSTSFDYSIPPYSSLLAPGREFKGIQRCSWNEEGDSSFDEWIVRVQIKEYEPQRGYLSGTLKGMLKSESPVVTFWEGEIIDNENHTFSSEKWGVGSKTDMDNWTRFSAFMNLTNPSMSEKWMVSGLKECPYIFMRWKESCFITRPVDTESTIQGFYYICMCRATGDITGFYHDIRHNPSQELVLSPNTHGKSGFCFSNSAFR